MANADIIISRAGANTIFEICSIGKPFILVPFKNSIDDDQFKNAKFFFDKGACLIFNEVTSNPKMMSNMIINLISSKNERELEWQIKPEKLAGKIQKGICKAIR